jgi:hypothetical protein
VHKLAKLRLVIHSYKISRERKIEQYFSAYLPVLFTFTIKMPDGKKQDDKGGNNGKKGGSRTG